MRLYTVVKRVWESCNVLHLLFLFPCALKLACSTIYITRKFVVLCCVVVNNTKGLDMVYIRNTRTYFDWDREKEKERDIWHDLSWHILGRRRAEQSQRTKLFCCFFFYIHRMCTTRISSILQNRYIEKRKKWTSKWTKENSATMYLLE